MALKVMRRPNATRRNLAGWNGNPELACMNRFKWRSVVAVAGLTTLCLSARQSLADEQLFGFTRGAETLPQGRSELYQYVTARTGKDEGDYLGLDFETEAEHGFTDKFQASISLTQHYFNNYGVDGSRDALPDSNQYRIGGLATSAKYNLLSPFKDPLGLAFRLETGYLWNDAVAGQAQHEIYVTPEIDLQKNFRDDTIIWVMNGSVQMAWGNVEVRMKWPWKAAPASPTGSRRTGFWEWRATLRRRISRSASISLSTSSSMPGRACITAPSVGG